MHNLINYLLESGIALGAFALFYLVALKQEKSFVFNRFYLLGSTVLALLLPLLHFSLESIPSNLVVGTIFLQPMELGSTQETTQTFAWETWIYGLVAALLLIRLLFKSLPLLKARRQSTPVHGYKMVVLENSNSAYTFWDTVFLGDQLNDREKELIWSHERVHASERHSLDLMFFEIVGVLLWINPILLILKKLARTNHEYLADAKVVNITNKESYVKSLAVQAIKRQGFELAHAFYSSSTLKRIKMINQQNNQIMKIKQIAPILLGLGLVLIFGCEDATEQLSDMSDQQITNAIGQVQTSNVKVAEGLEGVYDLVEVQPLPANGMNEFYKWIGENMQYPNQARREGVEGRVFIQFIVNEKGDITDVKSIKGIGAGCDAEAERVMKSAASWSPGMVDGKPVKVRMVMPITFKLS